MGNSESRKKDERKQITSYMNANDSKLKPSKSLKKRLFAQNGRHIDDETIFNEQQISFLMMELRRQGFILQENEI